MNLELLIRGTTVAQIGDVFELLPCVDRSRSPQRGFSLIELLVVVAIIGILAALSIPNLTSSQQAANSASALSSLRLIHSSETSYRTLSGTFGDLATLGNAGFIADPLLRSGVKGSYRFTATPDSDPAKDYEAKALPATDSTLRRHYFVDATGVVRFQMGAEANSASPSVD